MQMARAAGLRERLTRPRSAEIPHSSRSVGGASVQESVRLDEPGASLLLGIFPAGRLLMRAVSRLSPWVWVGGNRFECRLD